MNGGERAQARIQTLCDELVACGREVGLQVAVLARGRVVVDVTSGTADPVTGSPVAGDTLFYAASTAKGVASTVAHVLVERRALDYDMRAVDVWPEFGSHGKATVTLRHVLLHTAGVPGLPADITVAELCDWDRMCAILADSEPWWEPGSRFGYHALTFGFLVGEIIRRATGHTISALLDEFVTGPLGVRDEVHFAVPDRLLGLVARQVAADSPPAPPPPGSSLARAIPAGIRPSAAFANRPDVLTSEIPSAGTMTARGVARMYSALLGHVEGVSLVSPRRLRELTAIAFSGMDEVMGFPTEWAFGYSPYRPARSKPGSTFGMVGANGSVAYADIDSGVATAVMRNRFAPGDSSALSRIDRIVAEELG
jgi:CubicO group peptidase (beta-lactamase class C family)